MTIFELLSRNEVADAVLGRFPDYLQKSMQAARIIEQYEKAVSYLLLVLFVASDHRSDYYLLHDNFPNK